MKEKLSLMEWVYEIPTPHIYTLLEAIRKLNELKERVGKYDRTSFAVSDIYVILESNVINSGKRISLDIDDFLADWTLLKNEATKGLLYIISRSICIIGTYSDVTDKDKWELLSNNIGKCSCNCSYRYHGLSMDLPIQDAYKFSRFIVLANSFDGRRSATELIEKSRKLTDILLEISMDVNDVKLLNVVEDLVIDYVKDSNVSDELKMELSDIMRIMSKLDVVMSAKNIWDHLEEEIGKTLNKQEKGR